MTAPMVALRSTAPSHQHKHLIDEGLWKRLVDRMVSEKVLEPAYAERLLDQALGFLLLCAKNPGESFAPSDAVDIAWHTFILHTRDYAAFCERIAGRFIHHDPVDESLGTHHCPGTDTPGAMRSLGIHVDDELWNSQADCGGKSCYSCTSK